MEAKKLRRCPLAVGAILDEDGNTVAQTFSQIAGDPVAAVEDRNAIADRIALCWNRHERLMEALENLLRVDDEWHGAVNSEMAQARSIARAALKLAEEEA